MSHIRRLLSITLGNQFTIFEADDGFNAIAAPRR